MSYRIRDLLMFSARTYNRLFENYNRDVWPLHLLAVAIGALIVVLLWSGGRLGRRGPAPEAGAAPLAGALLAICWLWVAYAFLWQRFSTIHTYAKWFAAAFVVEGVLLLVPWKGPGGLKPAAPLFFFALILFLYPLLSPRRELFALAPDPTALATIALGSRSRWFLLPIPILWCAFIATTHLAMAAR